MFELLRITIFPYIRFLLPLLLLLVSGGNRAQALDLSTYAPASRLAQDRWVKVAVAATGMHCIPEATLRAWGFNNPEKVKVYGYGAARLPEMLSADLYIDDLPQTPSEVVEGKGLYFYAEGPLGQQVTISNFFRPVQHPFATEGYYFLSDREEERRTPAPTTAQQAGNEDITWFYDRVFHEEELVSPGEAGFMLLGEDFRFNPTRSFTFNLPDLDAAATDGATAEPATVNMELSFVAKTLTEKSTLSITANGTVLPQVNADIVARTTDKYSHGSQAIIRKSFAVAKERLDLTVAHKTVGTVSLANLNYIAVAYPRRLRLPASRTLAVNLNRRGTARLAGATASTRVWDVTDPLAIRLVKSQLEGSVASWKVGSTRSYVAWEPEANLPAPRLAERSVAQNLHAMESPEMVIFTPGEWRAEAERLAEFHRTSSTDPLTVAVFTPEQVYNEFSSGTPDVQAFRKLLKMFYDRSREGIGKKLRYALFFCRPTYDFRQKTAKVKALGYPTLPAWFTEAGLNDNNSYTTDDIFAFLEDDSGLTTARDILSIAVGRIPATSVADARGAVDKILAYASRSPKGTWRNNVLIVADDDDQGVHMEDAERMWKGMCSNGASTAFMRKIYIDEYELIAAKYPEARTQLYRALDEGVMWWTFQGHANPSSLTAESLVTYNDLNNFFLRHFPVVYAATCDFLRWDSAVTSGAELLFKNPNGGVIGAISATRPVYITDNGNLSEAFGRQLFKRTGTGNIRTLGEIYRAAKNDYRTETGEPVANANKLRYVLMGDPALQLVLPSNRVVLEEVGGTRVENIETAANPVQLMARQQTVLKGRVTAPDGSTLTNFNGVVNVVLHDAEVSVTTHGNGKDGKPVTFDKPGGRLFVGTDSVRAGVFEFKLNMPAEVADNYRPATLNMAAYASNGNSAAGVCRDLYVYGTDHTALPDTAPPAIESIYLNHPTFRPGQEVNAAPMLMATVTDDRAINLSNAGAGHQMALYLDGGSKSYTDVADFFTPFTDGRPGGTIAYPLDDLPVGPHSLRLRVWDTGPNSAEATVDFVVAKRITPVIYDVYTTANPATDRADFYISHDRPDRMLTVTVEVFDLLGRALWSSTVQGRSEQFTSIPVTWNLCDRAGRPVGRGIYLYRATISDDHSGERTATASRKLAVAPR